MHQRQRETFLIRAEPGLLLALVPAHVRLALDHHCQNAIVAAQLLEVGDLIGNILALGGAGRAEHNHVFAPLDCGTDRGGQVSVCREVFFVTENRVDPVGDGFIQVVGSAD